MVAGEKISWSDLHERVVQTGLCAGCGACVMACPRDVLDYDHANYRPVNLEPTTSADQCAHCQAAMNGTLQARGVNKYARRIQLTIGLLCSKTFQYQGLRRLIEEYGVPLADVAKLDIKGRLLVWRRSTGEHVDIPLKRLRPFTREGCRLCPDFAASLADLSVGGLGQQAGWTLTVVRTKRGADWLQGAAAAGAIQVRPGEEDPAAIALLAELAAKSRQRILGTPTVPTSASS